ncbi:MAG TPA: gliding motility-associated C-terminal domain-containing protein [Chloroflexota bacterium]|nr:gliding motility-associated C-terminal domain-containing protein [Chloroflexota bacterium]
MFIANWWRASATALSLLLGLALGSCRASGSLLYDVYLTDGALATTGPSLERPALLHYSLARPAAISVWLIDSAGQRRMLRERQPRPAGQDYQLPFDGTYATTDNPPERRVVPPGEYRLTIEATDERGWREEATEPVAVLQADTEAPRIENLVAYPEVISPNFDAIDDVAQISFRLSKPARVSLYAVDEQGRRVYVGTRDEKREAGEYAETWNGLVNEHPLPDGRYYYTVEARDQAGNVTIRRIPIVLAAGGVPKAKITHVYIAPRQVLLGASVQVEIGVKNIGDTIIRTQGPDPGFVYNSYESFGSIAGGAYIDRAGFWRVGIDWTGAPTTAGARFPYRWGFGHDLAPGEEVTVTGAIQMLHRVTKVLLFAGLVQEGHRYYDDGVGRTQIEISF